MEPNLKQELENRIAAYRIERRNFWLKEFPPLVVLTAVVVFGLSYLGNSYVGPMIADWRLVAALFSVTALIAPVWMMAPEKPTYEAVEHDKLLNQIGAAIRTKQTAQ